MPDLQEKNTARGRAVGARPAAFIDVDLTLLRCESFPLFVRAHGLSGGPSAIMRIGAAWLLKRFGRLTVAHFKERSLCFLVGQTRRELERIGETFCRRYLVPRIRPGADECLRWHKQEGHRIYLASGSPEFYVRALADYVGAQGYVATQLEYGEQERFTGRFLGGDCVAELKAEKVRALADSLSVDLSASYAYSDVANDIPLLGAVGTPVGVWPERRLHSYCLDNNWRVEYW